MFIAVLDNIRSLYNVGSIFRTADAFGVDKICLCGYTPAPTKDRQKKEIHKTALGAEEFIAWERHSQTWKLLDDLKKQGFYIIGLEIDKKSVNISKFKPVISVIWVSILLIKLLLKNSVSKSSILLRGL